MTWGASPPCTYSANHPKVEVRQLRRGDEEYEYEDDQGDNEE